MNRIGGRTIMFRLLRLTQLKRPPTEAALLLVSEHRYLPIQLPQLYIMAVHQPLGTLFGGLASAQTRSVR